LARQLDKAHGDRARLAINDEHQAELELAQNKPDYKRAKILIDSAFRAQNFVVKTVPQYYPLHIRAGVLLGLGLESAALAEFRRAVDAADLWRRGALPGDITSTRTVIQLHQVYQDYVELAARPAIKNKDSVLAGKALEVLAANRAATLREQLTIALGRDLRLPARYFELRTLYSSKPGF
jgi:hypothetical protein